MTQALIEKAAYKPRDVEPTHNTPEFVHAGNIIVGWQGFGMFIPTYQHLEGVPSEERDEAIKGLELFGVGGNYQYPPTVDIRSQEAQHLQTRHITEFVQELARQANWDGVDILTIGSSSTTSEAMDEAVQDLKATGLTIDAARKYFLLCASASQAMVDVLRDDGTRGARVMNIGIEALSGRLFPDNEKVQPALFGNGIAGVAYTAHKDIKYHGGETRIIRDPGTIEIPSVYRLPTDQERLTDLPRGYSIKNGENLADILAVVRDGVYLLPPASPDSFAHINPRKNIALFSKELPPLFMQVFQDYLKMKKNEQEVNPVLMHQPSFAVWSVVVSKIAERCAQQDIPFDPNTDAPWLMSGLDSGNTSSATILRALLEMIKGGQLKPGLLTPVVGLGIGAVLHGDEIELSS